MSSSGIHKANCSTILGKLVLTPHAIKRGTGIIGVNIQCLLWVMCHIGHHFVLGAILWVTLMDQLGMKTEKNVALTVILHLICTGDQENCTYMALLMPVLKK